MLGTPHHTKPRVLLLDDERFLLEIYSIKFHKEGYDVYACTSADDAIAALESGYDPDAILFDITMPETSGYEFLERTQERRLGLRSLKIALTNEGQDAEIQRTADLGTHAHIMKAGYTAGELVHLVTSLLSEKEQVHGMRVFHGGNAPSV